MINETTGICPQCQKGNHDICPMVMSGTSGGMAFCTCACKPESSNDMSLGAPPGSFPKLSKKQKEEFPQHETDPLDNIL